MPVFSALFVMADSEAATLIEQDKARAEIEQKFGPQDEKCMWYLPPPPRCFISAINLFTGVAWSCTVFIPPVRERSMKV